MRRETFDLTLFAGAAAVARRGILVQPRDRSGPWSCRHARRSRLPERRILQARLRLSLRARAALFRPADHRPRRRNAEGRRRRQPVCAIVYGEPPGPVGRQVLHRRRIRHQQIRQQSEDRFHELDAHQCRHLRLCRRCLGLHLWRGGRMVSGHLYLARRRVRSVGERRPAAE